MSEIRHPHECKTFNDVVYMIALRAKELGDEKMRMLRMINAYDCDNENQMKEKDQGKSRGDIIEEILIEEFVLDNDKDFDE